jgi:prepilin-type N-terminal cleavage/methylation domain-containing protein
MVFKNISNLEKGITLIEIIVVIFIIGIFSVILVSDFPKIQRLFALSRSTYKLGQDIRRAEDLGLSGVQVNDIQKNLISIKGYGIYINFFYEKQKYLIYADVDSPNSPANQMFDGNFSTLLCNERDKPAVDCVIEIVDIAKENLSLTIKNIENVNTLGYVDINFSPPDPTVKINNIKEGSDRVGIVFGLSSGSSERTVWTNKSGMIEVE